MDERMGATGMRGLVLMLPGVTHRSRDVFGVGILVGLSSGGLVLLGVEYRVVLVHLLLLSGGLVLLGVAHHLRASDRLRDETS